MAWPKGVPRKLKPQADGSVVIETEKTAEQIAQTVSVATRRKTSLADARFDPFTKFKTDEKRFHYRALNVNKRNIREREAEGYETIPGTEYGDLILGRLPKTDYEEQVTETREKTQNQTAAVVEQFKEEAARHGVEVDSDVGT